jgi:hypothetical protein
VSWRPKTTSPTSTTLAGIPRRPPGWGGRRRSSSTPHEVTATTGARPSPPPRRASRGGAGQRGARSPSRPPLAVARSTATTGARPLPTITARLAAKGSAIAIVAPIVAPTKRPVCRGKVLGVRGSRPLRPGWTRVPFLLWQTREVLPQRGMPSPTVGTNIRPAPMATLTPPLSSPRARAALDLSCRGGTLKGVKIPAHQAAAR